MIRRLGSVSIVVDIACGGTVILPTRPLFTLVLASFLVLYVIIFNPLRRRVLSNCTWTILVDVVKVMNDAGKGGVVVGVIDLGSSCLLNPICKRIEQL